MTPSKLKSEFLLIPFLFFLIYVMVQTEKTHGSTKLYWIEETGIDSRKVRRANIDGSDIEDLDSTRFSEIGSPVLDLVGEKMYWINSGGSSTIHRADLDGGGVEDLVISTNILSNLALDMEQRKMYWIDWTVNPLFTSTLKRANLNGSKVEDLPYDVSPGSELKIADGKLYWTFGSEIQQADLGGTKVTSIIKLENFGHNFDDIGIDVNGSKIYWILEKFTGSESTYDIQRANLDGSDVEDVTDGQEMSDLALDLNHGKIYWNDFGISSEQSDNKIRRANLDGSDVEDILTGLIDGGIALDPAKNKIYWSGVDNSIKRANLDGTNVVTLIVAANPEDIALDMEQRKIYWVDVYNHKIQRAELDGSGVVDLVSIAKPNQFSPLSNIALDRSGGKIYWNNWLNRSTIKRANLDGSNVQDVITGLQSPRDIALDISSEIIYWTDSETEMIQQAKLDGSRRENVITGLISPTSLTLDGTHQKLYWIDGDKIQRANLDGSNIQEVITGLEFPGDIALDLDENKVYWTLRLLGKGKIQRANLDGTGIEDVVTGLSNPSKIVLLGRIPETVTISVNKGWNLISVADPLKTNSINEIINNSNIAGWIWWWKQGTFKVAGELSPNFGYWLYAREKSQINISSD